MSALDRTLQSGARKAAILLSLLDEADAVPVLRSMPSGDQARVAAELANLPRVPAEVAVQVLDDYKRAMAAQKAIAVGGRDLAVHLLVKALGENGAKSIVERLNQAADGGSIDLDAVKRTEPQRVARFLSGEHAQTKAFVLGQLDGRQASALLMNLEPQERADCVKRMATMGQFSPDAAAKASVSSIADLD